MVAQGVDWGELSAPLEQASGSTRLSAMDQAGQDFDLDELWPPAADLVALRFPNEHEFARCRAVLWNHLDCYRAVNKWDLLVVVRKTDLPILRDAGLSYAEVELIEAQENPTEEERADQRAMMKRYMGLWLQELGWDKR
jgi:hypothetical protein